MTMETKVKLSVETRLFASLAYVMLDQERDVRFFLQPAGRETLVVFSTAQREILAFLGDKSKPLPPKFVDIARQLRENQQLTVSHPAYKSLIYQFRVLRDKMPQVWNNPERLSSPEDAQRLAAVKGRFGELSVFTKLYTSGSVVPGHLVARAATKQPTVRLVNPNGASHSDWTTDTEASPTPEFRQQVDQQLLLAIASRDQSALEKLYDQYANLVCSIAIKFLQNSGAAEEVTQDVFYNVWSKASTYSPRLGAVRTWLCSIAHHRAIDELRKRQREVQYTHYEATLKNESSGGEDDTFDYTVSQQESEEVQKALDFLRPEQRETLILAYFHGLTNAEIASRLAQPLGTVKTRIRRGLQRLKEVLSQRQTQIWETS